MSAFDRTVHSTGGAPRDLASFFRSLASPRLRRAAVSPVAAVFGEPDWPAYLRSSHAQPLEFFDANLSGKAGAAVVLRELERNPATKTVTLSQNDLGDDGVREFVVGFKRLRASGVGGRLKELNLSGNHLTDTALHLLALHLLQPSPHPPSITNLYVTANQFCLSPTLSTFLGSVLSSPVSSLTCLSLTNNPTIGYTGLTSLLSALRLSSSALSQLHLSLCNLTPNCVVPLAEWLEDPEGAGSSLQILALNGNYLSAPGLKRLARCLTSGKCSGLLELECFANEDDIAPEWDDVVRALEDDDRLAVLREEELARASGATTPPKTLSWREKLETAKDRNRRVLRETRTAALSLLAPIRVLFAGNPRERGVDVKELMREASLLDDDSVYRPAKVDGFPFLRLPIELQVHVLRCALLLRPSTDAHRFPLLSSSRSTPTPSSSPRSPPSPPQFSSPLTEHQFLRLLAHAGDRTTLLMEARLAKGFVPQLGTNGSFVNGSGGGGEGEWEEWVLRGTGCNRFERA